MDPLTICATVASLVKTCGTAVTTCNGLLNKYKNAPDLLASIRTECTTIKMTLSYIDWLVKRDTDLLSSQLKDHGPLAETFEVALTGYATTFSLLDAELQQLYNGNQDDKAYKWKDKMRYMWDENHVKDLLNHMRGLRSAVNLVVAALQMSSMSALVSLLQNQKPVIERVRQDTRSMRASRSLQLSALADANEQESSEEYSVINSSIGDEEFSFDDEIVNSFAYRNAIKKLTSKAKSTARPDRRRILDEPLIDLEFSSQIDYGPGNRSTGIPNHHFLAPHMSLTHSSLSYGYAEDPGSIIPILTELPNQQVQEKGMGLTCSSDLNESGSADAALAIQEDIVPQWPLQDSAKVFFSSDQRHSLRHFLTAEEVEQILSTGGSNNNHIRMLDDVGDAFNHLTPSTAKVGDVAEIMETFFTQYIDDVMDAADRLMSPGQVTKNEEIRAFAKRLFRQSIDYTSNRFNHLPNIDMSEQITAIVFAYIDDIKELCSGVIDFEGSHKTEDTAAGLVKGICTKARSRFENSVKIATKVTEGSEGLTDIAENAKGIFVKHNVPPMPQFL